MSEILKLDQARPEVQRRFMVGVYARMVVALVLTAVAALVTVTVPEVLRFVFASKYTFMGLIIAELAIVMILSLLVRKLSPFVAGLMFVLYSIINGMTLSSIFLVYQLGSIVTVFFISAGMFLAMTIYGMFTKTNLNSAGRYLMMALFGLIIVGIVNFFLKSSMLEWIYSVVGVAIFVGLTAYDTQKLRQIAIYDDGSQNFKKFAIIGALELYLDFINIFLKLLRLFGKKK
ncbi:MAG: Bax inhibitor-1/YccA family protein [Treponema sp.]|nr:Bax inhibitor-1/YccA family protein [Treponema sp.]